MGLCCIQLEGPSIMRGSHGDCVGLLSFEHSRRVFCQDILLEVYILFRRKTQLWPSWRLWFSWFRISLENAISIYINIQKINKCCQVILIVDKWCWDAHCMLLIKPLILLKFCLMRLGVLCIDIQLSHNLAMHTNIHMFHRCGSILDLLTIWSIVEINMTFSDVS